MYIIPNELLHHLHDEHLLVLAQQVTLSLLIRL